MRRLRHSVGLLVLIVGGCPKAPRVQAPDQVGPTVSAPAHVHLRNSFDTDPSVYLGRFVPAGTTDLDETAAMPLTCSAQLEARTVGGGGVTYDETFLASQSAALRIGVPGIASASAGASRGAVVRVRYELVEKMIATPTDPGAFEACCKAAPDQCTDRYIGEFLSGTGTVYYEVSEEAGGGVEVPATAAAGADGEVELKHGTAWKRAIEFPNPVYFAFKTTENRWSATVASGGCGPWTDAPPRSSQGTYFVGISHPRATEAEARRGASLSGREQVVQFLSEEISTGRIEMTETSGAVAELTAIMNAESRLESSASGVAKRVKDEAWCIEDQATPDGALKIAKVLMFLPKEQEAALAESLLSDAASDTSGDPADPADEIEAPE